MKALLSFAALSFLAVPALGAEISGDAICPRTIAVTQTAMQTPAGFEAVKSDQPVTLAALTIFDGPPKDLASLEPDNGDSGQSFSVWTLSADKQRGLWVSCIYSGTTIVLQRRLPDTTTSCRVTYDQNSHIDGYDEIKTMSCK